VALSWSRVAEDLLRSGSAASLQWEGISLTTQFQPIHSARRGERAGYEALARAHDASGAPASIDGLIERAEASGLVVHLDRTLRALHLRNFATVDPGDGKLFIRVHPQAAIADLGNVREFADLVRYYGLTPQRLCIVVLPDACGAEDALAQAAAAYREIGVTIALDAFGVGCSNLDRLAALRPTLVKLQQSTLSQAMGETKARAAFPAMVGMLKDAGCQVVVDGVETVQQALAAIDSGASFLQGGYLSGPGNGVGSDEYVSKILGRLALIGAERVTATAGDW
jgi:EAL domain-containing protein (putative c-di-GMP-specific phosphodiesterase class I)